MELVTDVAREQTRARYPAEEGYVERNGIRVFWERYGEGEPTILLQPTWEIVHSRSWKMQIPFLARDASVRGNGKSHRPPEYEDYVRAEFADDARAKENRHYWLRDWEGDLEQFFGACFTEPHSTKAIEDCVGWGLETDAETILTGFRGWETKEITPETTRELAARVRCPVLVIQGSEDALMEPQPRSTSPRSFGRRRSCSTAPGPRRTCATPSRST